MGKLKTLALLSSLFISSTQVFALYGGGYGYRSYGYYTPSLAIRAVNIKTFINRVRDYPFDPYYYYGLRQLAKRSLGNQEKIRKAGGIGVLLEALQYLEKKHSLCYTKKIAYKALLTSIKGNDLSRKTLIQADQGTDFLRSQLLESKSTKSKGASRILIELAKHSHEVRQQLMAKETLKGIRKLTTSHHFTLKRNGPELIRILAEAFPNRVDEIVTNRNLMEDLRDLCKSSSKTTRRKALSAIKALLEGNTRHTLGFTKRKKLKHRLEKMSESKDTEIRDYAKSCLRFF